MAYSSIGHMGFALVGLAPARPRASQGVLIYMAIYVVDDARHLRRASCRMRRNGQRGRERSPISPGLARTNPLLAFCLAMMMFSLAGIPPLAGFFAKFYVFVAAIKAGLCTLAVIGVLASVVGAFYYLRHRQGDVFRRAAGRFDRDGRRSCASCSRSSASCSILFFVYPGPLVSVAAAAAQVAVLGWHSRSVHEAHIRGLPARSHSTASARPTRKRMARARAGETGPMWFVTTGADRRARPAATALGLAARAISPASVLEVDRRARRDRVADTRASPPGSR